VHYAERNGSKKLDKLTIKYLPLSLSGDEVARMLKENNVKLASDVKYTCVREVSGLLTSYKNGDRFVYVEPFDPPLPKEQTVANFRCLVLHHGKESPCLACDVAGHKVGDSICRAKPTDPILSFRTHEHPLSNQYPCALEVHGRTFQSVDHAFYWRMAMEFGKEELADEIVAAKHAGVVRRLALQLGDDSERWAWEEHNLGIMEEILECKAQQCDRFRDCLLENADMVLAQASRDKLWGTGLSAYVTEHTAPDFWPGKNILGAMLRDLTSQLLLADAGAEVREDPPGGTPESETPHPHPQATVASSIASSLSDDRADAPSNPPDIATSSSSVAAPHSPGRTASSSSSSSCSSSSAVPQQLSTPRSPRRGTTSHRGRPSNKTLATKRSQPANLTQNIRTYFNRKPDKRKELASSPDQEVSGQGKVLRPDKGVS